MEYLDVVDENGNLTGETVERNKAHLLGIRHRTAHVWLLRKKSSKVQVLLQKRSLNKSSFPGCYDISSAGHIPSGSDYIDSAIRELKEELGIDVLSDELIFCGDRNVIWDDNFNGKPFHDRQCSRVFCVWKDIPEDQFVLQKEELDSVMWMDLDECILKVKEKAFKNCIHLNELYMIKAVIEK